MLGYEHHTKVTRPIGQEWQATRSCALTTAHRRPRSATPHAGKKPLSCARRDSPSSGLVRGGVTKQTAHQLVLRAFGELREKLAETAEQVLTLELQRLDALTEALWPTATAGDPQAIDRVLRIMQRRAALLGLDALARVLPSETVPETLGSRVCIYLPDNQRGDLPVEVPEGLSE
jgi:hypothetical protein